MELLKEIDAAPGDHFDYEQMNDAAAKEAMAAVERYKGRSDTDILTTGRDLLAVKARVEHGLFLKWVRAEMVIPVRTAQRYMHVAAQLRHEPESVAQLAPTSLHAVASTSFPHRSER